MAHAFSIGLRSGEFGGHSSTVTFMSPRTIFADLEVCAGAPSYWNTMLLFWSPYSLKMLGSNLERNNSPYSFAPTPLSFLPSLSKTYPVVPDTFNRFV